MKNHWDALSALLKMQVITSRRFFPRSLRYFPFFFAKLNRPKCQKFNEPLLSRWSQSTGRKNQKCPTGKHFGALEPSLGHIYGDVDLQPRKTGSPFGMSRMNDFAEIFWGDLPVIPLSKSVPPWSWANFNILGFDTKWQKNLAIG